MQTYRCKADGQWTPCRGGTNASDEGDGYCAEGYRGPRCELCDGPAYSKHFDTLSARCQDCGNATARVAIMVSTVLFMLLAYFGLNTVIHRHQGLGTRGALRLVQWVRSAWAVWKAAGMRYKVKALVGFYQCVSAVPSVYNVVPPESLEEYTRWIYLLELPSELESIFVPSACLGEYHERVLLGSSWPIVLILMFAAGFVGWELLQADRPATGAASRGVRCAALGCGLQRVLPLMLTLTFLVVPSTSTRIFKSFLCEQIEYSSSVDTRRYLAADLALDCESDQYTTARLTAFASMTVWPVGIPLLYAALLCTCREAISTYVPTRLSRATAFLWSDYSPHAFWWEPLEMCRKLVLAGWLVLIEEKAELARVVVALLVSIAFLTLRVSVRPLRRCAVRIRWLFMSNAPTNDSCFPAGPLAGPMTRC
eukprot:184203-Prymnesium_polylepis.1